MWNLDHSRIALANARAILFALSSYFFAKSFAYSP
ncbi:hypothetical protein BH09GEM1_BH09GEM1_43180 [soil metagenome]